MTFAGAISLISGRAKRRIEREREREREARIAVCASSLYTARVYLSAVKARAFASERRHTLDFSVPPPPDLIRRIRKWTGYRNIVPFLARE